MPEQPDVSDWRRPPDAQTRHAAAGQDAPGKGPVQDGFTVPTRPDLADWSKPPLDAPDFQTAPKQIDYGSSRLAPARAGRPVLPPDTAGAGAVSTPSHPRPATGGAAPGAASGGAMSPRPGAAPAGFPQSAPSGQTGRAPHGQPQGFTGPSPHQPTWQTSPGMASPGVAWQQGYYPAAPRPQAAQAQAVWTAPAHQTPVRRIVGWILVGVGALLLLAMLGFGMLMYSPSVLLLTAFLASFSLLTIVALTLLADLWHPQAKETMALAVLWGAVAAVLLTFAVNIPVDLIVQAIIPSSADVIGSVIEAPVIEESAKGLCLVIFVFAIRRSFNGPLDGLIYGALVGGGFAFTENILYYSDATYQAGIGGLFVTAFMRGILGIFGHAVYTSCTGLIMGWLVRTKGPIWGACSFPIALIPGIFLHGLWNFGATFWGYWIFAVGVVVDIVWLAILVALIFEEARATRIRLGDYANAGWLTHEEVQMLASWGGRSRAKRWAATFNAKPLMKRFIRDSTELAFTRQRIIAGATDPKTLGEEQQLLDKLSTNRRALFAAKTAADSYFRAPQPVYY